MTGGAEARVDGLPDVEGDLEAVQRALARLEARHATRIAEAARHNLGAGGKRLRPLLTCAVMRSLGANPAPLMDAITAVELVHAGSLLHDDVIDGAETRRGRRAVHAAFDVHTAILAGDFLLTWAVDRLARIGLRDLQLALATALRDVCEGEVLERERRFDETVGLAHVRLVNRLKTASLFAYAGEAGALLAGGSGEVRDAARTYGLALGEAFQTIDDLLDWQGDATAIGKPPGHDLADGLVTVPVALGGERDPRLREEIRAFWIARREGDGQAGARLSELRERLDRSGAFGEARRVAESDSERALSALHVFPAGPWRERLAAIAATAAARDR